MLANFAEYIIVFGTLLLKVIFYSVLSMYEFIIQFVNPKRKDIRKDVILITGGASGLGRLMCIEFSKLSNTVISWDINKEGLLETSNLVKEETGSTLLTYVCDCGDRESIRLTAEKVRNEVGTVTLLINNAGIVVGKSIIDLSDDLWEKTFRVNFMAHFWTTREFLPDMRRHGRGHLVYLVSSAGIYGAPQLSDYCSSKAAGLSFSETLDGELTLCGLGEVIKVTCVAPFIIKTDLFRGCKLRYPLLTPFLEPDYVVKRIIAGVLCDQKWIGIGRHVYWLNLLKSLVPTKGLIALYKFTGAFNMMETFKKENVL